MTDTCNCIKSCPCYPKCDEMMEAWEESSGAAPVRSQSKIVDLSVQDGEVPQLMKLAQEDEEDFVRFKEMIPEEMRELVMEVEQACDAMEYKGSMMFDESMAKGTIQKMVDEIQERVTATQIQTQSNPYGRRRPSHCSDPDCLMEDLIRVLLHQELHHRRCRNRNCRRW